MASTNKGNYLIRQILKRIDTESNSTSQQEPDFNSELKVAKSHHDPHKNIVLHKKQKSIYKRIFKLSPTLPMNHIYRLFGVIGINEKAIKNPGFEESFFYTYFQERVIERVQFYQHAIVLELASPSLSSDQPGLEYLLEKYKSQGDMTFYELALMIEETVELLKSLPGQPPEEKAESVKKWLDFLGDSMYVCTLGMKKVAISKALLKYLDYDLEQFSVEAIKYRALFHEFFSSVSYKAGLIHCIKNIKNTVLLSQGKISLSEYKELTTFKFTDFIYSKDHIRSYCDMSFSLLNPSFFCHKINFVYYKQDDSKKRLSCGEIKGAIEGERERIHQEEYRTIMKLKNIPSILLKENQKLVASYKIIREDSQKSMKEETEQ